MHACSSPVHTVTYSAIFTNWYGHPIPMYPSDTSNCQHAAHALRAIIASEQSRSTTTYSQAFPTGIKPATIQGQVTICRWSGMTPSATRAPTRLAPWCPLRQPFGRNDPRTNKVATKHRELGDSLGVSWAPKRHLKIVYNKRVPNTNHGRAPHDYINKHNDLSLTGGLVRTRCAQ